MCKRAVAVQLRHRDEVLEPAGHRLPERVDEPECAVAVARPLLARAVGDHAHGREVVDLVELPALLGHLVVDRVEVLRAPRDRGGDVGLLQLEPEDRRGLVDLRLAVGAPVGDHRLDLRVLARVEDLEGQVLELPLERMDPEPVREGRVDLERLLRLADLRLLPPVLARAHVVEPVRELDEDDPHVVGHRDDHLAVVLRLRLLAALELRPRQLRDALHELGDLGAELRAQLVELSLGVLEDVVKERRGDRLLVEVELGADPGDPVGMVDEVLARTPELAAMLALRVGERPANQVPVDAAVVGLDRGQKLFDEALVVLLGVDDRHRLSVRAEVADSPHRGEEAWGNGRRMKCMRLLRDYLERRRLRRMLFMLAASTRR